MYGSSSGTVDPLEGFYNVLMEAWGAVSREYDVFYDLPDPVQLFKNIELHDPCIAAEMVILNMLIEITEMVDRFSPWYKLPARSFGLTSIRDIITHKNVWRLAPEAIEKWNHWIDRIAGEIDQKAGLIKAVLLIDGIDTLDDDPDESVLAVCHCSPPNELLLKKSFLMGEKILCNHCKQPFLSVEEKER